MRNLLLSCLIISAPMVFAGQGRDGGWPQSIDLLRLSKKNLVEMMSSVNDQEVQGLSGMKTLVEKLQVSDVIEIENDRYQGSRLFYSEGFQKFFATKNFYNNERYQMPMGEFGVALVREVQTLVLTEVLESSGVQNSAVNAAKIINTLNEKTKAQFSPAEKMEVLKKLLKRSSVSSVKGQKFCVSYNELGQSEASEMSVQGKMLDGGYLITQGASDELLVCHDKIQVLDRFEEIHLAIFYSKKNLLSNLDYAPEASFKQVLKSRFMDITDTFEELVRIESTNSGQSLQNIKVKIMSESREDYQKLISFEYTDSKPADQEIAAKLNGLMNSDLSTVQSSFWGLYFNLRDQLVSEMDSMNNVSRKEWLAYIYNDFEARLGNLFDSYQEEKTKNDLEVKACERYPQIGEFHKCSFTQRIMNAEDMVQFSKKLVSEKKALDRYVESLIRRN